MLGDSKAAQVTTRSAQRRVDGCAALEFEETLRRTGIDPVGLLPWGAHLCLFYESAKDLIDIHSRYLGAGIEEGEFCIWALSDPVTHDDAVAGLSRTIPGFRRHLTEG